jgi:small Trp-rich protein
MKHVYVDRATISLPKCSSLQGKPAMPLILLILGLTLLRYFEIWKFAQMSWWWVIGAMVVAFIWFEYIERIIGKDRRKDDLAVEKQRKERLEKTFGKRK